MIHNLNVNLEKRREYQLNKKILSSLITTILIVSILVFPTPYVGAAPDLDLIDELSLDEGPIGVSVTINGTTDVEINETYPVKIYWSTSLPTAATVESKYGYAGKLLATVDSPVEGTNDTYEVDITVPNVADTGTTGEEDIYFFAWQDENNNTKVDGGEWDYIKFTVKPDIYPTSGNVGDEIVVGGWTNTTGGKVEVYWENQNPENKLAETYAKGDGSFSVKVAVPEAPYESATHYIIVYDALKRISD